MEKIDLFFNEITLNNQSFDEILLQNLKSAEAIYQRFPKILEMITKKHFNPKMEKFAQEKGLIYRYDGCNEKMIKFFLDFPQRGDYLILFCWEKGNGYVYGLMRDILFISDEERQRLHQYLKNAAIADVIENEWWAFAKTIPSLTIENWQEDIINSDKFFQDCKTKIEEILEAMKGIDL